MHGWKLRSAPGSKLYKESTTEKNVHSFLCLQIHTSFSMFRMVPHAESCREIKVTFSSPIWTCQIIREERKRLTANCYSLSCLKDCAWVAHSYSLKVGKERNICYQFLRMMGTLLYCREHRDGAIELMQSLH